MIKTVVGCCLEGFGPEQVQIQEDLQATTCERFVPFNRMVPVRARSARKCYQNRQISASGRPGPDLLENGTEMDQFQQLGAQDQF